MLDKTRPGGDWSAMDSAAQAGMVMGAIRCLGRLHVAILVASVAPATTPCSCRRPCCSGKAINFELRSAIDTIAQAVQLKSRVPYSIRSLCIMKLYDKGARTTFQAIADELGIDIDTVSKHYRSIIRWLRGAPAGKNSQSIEGQESAAWREAETALRNAGIVG